ncbi:MAG: glycoside hydrolase family 6 protein [Acidobacteriota bacterium]|nr:glycoside hydrolase family 6 protein [Acidobacteriota bacterium]
MTGTGTDERRRGASRSSTPFRAVTLALIIVMSSGMTGENPFAGKRLYVDPNSQAKRQAEIWKRSRPADAALIARIANQPVARWLGGWVADIRREVNQAVSSMVGAGSLPVLVAYNIPYRDCGSYSAGGSATANAYRGWIRNLASGVGGRNAIVILEPDALAGMDCLGAAGRTERVTLLHEAVTALRAQRAAVYIDAGHANWHAPEEMARRLRLAGIDEANGFSLNVSNFSATEANIAYGEKVSRLVRGKHFVIDTSRNGLQVNSKEWCNPRGRALGVEPTTNTGHPLVDAFLWVKAPGESDGTCGGGPQAGAWWSTYALELSRMASALSGRR